MDNTVKNTLQSTFGFDSFHTGQETVIRRILNGKSAAAIFPTGAGKSLCYQLPALMLPGMTLVVSPLLSLMKDQLVFLLSRNIPAGRLDSSLSSEEYSAVMAKAVRGELKILMISVERFRNERFRNYLKDINVSLLAVDEAHCISEWGHNFRPEYLRLPDYRREFGISQVLLLTATATGTVADDMCRKFGISSEDCISTGFYRSNLHLKVTPLEETGKRMKLLKDLSESPEDPAIVYVTLQKTAENLAHYLNREGVEAAPFHSGMKTDEKTSIQNRFMAGQLNCVVATIAFGMGIDKRNIRRVIHYDLPKSLENYSQEIGRAGRDGRTSHCVVYGDKSNLPVLENFVYGDTPDRQAVRTVLCHIKESSRQWEVKLTELSRESNIRTLPLKTLLVYLSIKGIIEPRHTFFQEYSFKYLIDPEDIIGQFRDERQVFVKALLDNCITRKVWTTVDVDAIGAAYPADRQRILKALEYFQEKQWIDLTARQAVEVYSVLNGAFDLEVLSDEMFRLFKKKEKTEIERIHNMIRFFEKDSCLNRNLALYFGEKIGSENCGHCSYCEKGQVRLSHSRRMSPLTKESVSELIEDILPRLGSLASSENLAKFLCGINMPLFTSIRAKSINGFGSLEGHPYGDVKAFLEL